MLYRHLILLAAALPLAACLDTPQPAGDDAGTAPAVDAAEVPVADAAPRIDAFVAPGMDFPPVGWTVDIIGGDVLDLDGDGVDDMLLFNQDAAKPERQGVFVLLGRSGERIGSTYHAHIPTDVIPRAVFVHPLSPDDSINDMLVLGEDVDDSNLYLEAFEGSDDLSFASMPRKQLNPFYTLRMSEQREAWWVTSGQFHGSGLDLLIGTGNYFAVMPFQWWGVDFPNNVDTAWQTGEYGTENEVRGAYAIATANAGYDDLVLVQIGGITWFNNDGAGTFDTVNDVPYQMSDCNQPWMFVHARAQFDGTGPEDIIGQCGKDVGARVLSTSDATHVHSGNFSLGSSIWIDLKIIERPGDTDTRPDILLMSGLDTCVEPAPVSLQTMTDLRIEFDSDDQRDELRGDVLPAIDLADSCPKDMLLGDFDDDDTVEIRIVHAGGVGECFDVSQSGIVACAD